MEIQRIALERSIRGGLWPLYEPFGDRSKKYGDVIKEWITPFVEHALEHKRKMSEKGQQIQTDQSTLLEYLVDSFDGNSQLQRRDLFLTLCRCYRHSRPTHKSVIGCQGYGSFIPLHPRRKRTKQRCIDVGASDIHRLYVHPTP